MLPVILPVMLPVIIPVRHAADDNARVRHTRLVSLTVRLCCEAQAAHEGTAEGLSLVRQLVGNNDEITDLRFVGPLAAPTHVAVATNSEQVRSRRCAQLCWRVSSSDSCPDF